MSTITGIVVEGKVVLEDYSLPNGTRVAVRVLHPDEGDAKIVV